MLPRAGAQHVRSRWHPTPSWWGASWPTSAVLQRRCGHNADGGELSTSAHDNKATELRETGDQTAKFTRRAATHVVTNGSCKLHEWSGQRTRRGLLMTSAALLCSSSLWHESENIVAKVANIAAKRWWAARKPNKQVIGQSMAPNEPRNYCRWRESRGRMYNATNQWSPSMPSTTMYWKQPKPTRIGWAHVGVLRIRMEVEEDSEGNLEDRLERPPNCTLPRKCPPSLCLVLDP